MFGSLLTHSFTSQSSLTADMAAGFYQEIPAVCTSSKVLTVSVNRSGHIWSQLATPGHIYVPEKRE